MRRLSTAIVILALATGTALAADLLAPPPGRDLVALSVHTTWATAQPGGANEGTCFIANTASGPVRVKLDASVLFADGTTQRLTGISDPGVLDVGGAFELNVFFVVPGDAALGPAWFVCEIQANAPGGRPEWEAGAAGFEVVP